MSTSVNIVSGLGIPSQIPLNPKQNSASEATLKDLGLNDNLAFTYEKGLQVYCRLEGTRYEWREVLSGEELTGLRDTDFTYPNGVITDDVDYSNKVYNFFPIITSPDNNTYIQEGDNITITGTGVQLDPFIINGLSSPFEKINEGSGDGYIIKDRDPNNYGPIGGFAVDFSTNFSASSTKGATGEFSFVTGSNNMASKTGAVSLGINNTSSGVASFTMGNFNTASEQYTFSLGSSNISSGPNSFSLGTSINSSGNYSLGIGAFVNSKSLLETVLGSFNTNYTPISASTWSTTDRLFTVGNGFNEFNRSDALLIYKNGLALLPSVTNSLIEDATGKAIVTREYLESILPTTVDGSETKLLEGTNITITGNGTTLTPYIISYTADDISQYTDEMAQDAVGTILQNTPTINFSYDDALETITADVNINASGTSTGILSGGNLSIGTLSTLWSIQEGEGYIYNSLTNTVNHILWETQEDLTPTYLNSNIATYILIDINSDVIQQTTSPTLSQLRTHIYIGKLAHTTFTEILFAITEPTRMFDVVGQINDLNYATGPINISGNNITYNGANLNINCSEGITYRPGANYINDRNSPSITTESSLTAATFRKKYRNDIGDWSALNTTDIDPNHYDDGSGILQLVPNNKWTIQVFWRFGGTGTIHCDYGQTYYDSKTEAILAINNPNIIEDPENKRDALKRGWLVVKKGATVLNNTYISEFFRAGKFGELLPTGNSTATLQSAYDNSLIPQIITSVDNGAFTIRRGSLFDTDNVFTIQNELGGITASITGEGYTTVSNLDTTNIFLSNRIEMSANSYLAYESFTSGNIFKSTINGWESGIKIDYQSDLSSTYTARSLVDKTYTDAKITQTITNGIITTAPSEDAVFDALALKYDASNPNGYETPSQLNTRDTNNRSRANHTGTQLAATISDFATAVRTAAVQDSITDAITTLAPSQNAVYDALELKQNATSTAITSTATLTNNGTTFSLSAFTGKIVNNSTVPATITNVAFAGASNITPSYFRTILYVDNTGTLIQFNGGTTDLTAQQTRDNIYVGIVVYVGGSVSVVSLVPNIDYNISNRFDDLANFIGNINQGNNIGANGANLQINKGAGYTFRRGSNYAINRTVPDVTTDAAATPIPAGVNLVGYRNGSGGWSYSAYSGSINPGLWDNNTGTPIAVANNRFTNQRVYFFNGTNTYVIYLGRTEYATLALAVSDAEKPPSIVDPATSPASLIGTVSVAYNATALNNITQAQFIQGPRFQGGSSTGGTSGSQTLQNTYLNSSDPQFITTAGLGAVTFQAGSGLNATTVLETKNDAGTVTAGITGNGAITGLTYNGYTPESNSNKATDFTTVNNTLYPTVQATKTYADGLVVGLLNDRGSYDASTNLYPSTGGSGTAGAIKKGNLWAISVAGTLGGVSVGIGDWVRALVDTPSQTAANWSVVEGNFGYVPENVANKSDSYTVSSSTTYASTKAVVDGLATKQNTLTNPITGTGTSGYLAKFTGSATQGISTFFDSGTNAGLGTISPYNDPGYRSFTVNGTSGGIFASYVNDVLGGYLASNATQTSLIESRNMSLGLYTNNLERITITGGGNVGIGTNTPATSPNNTTLGFVNGSLIQGRSSVPQLIFSSNIDGDYYNATYKTNNPAVQLVIDALGGEIVFKRAISGTAGNPVTWIDSGGFSSAGLFKINNLSGTGTRNVVADSSGNLSTDSTVYAPLASPTFTGTPSLPTGTIAVTQTAGDSSTKVATTAFVTGSFVNLTGNQTVAGQKTFSDIATFNNSAIFSRTVFQTIPTTSGFAGISLTNNATDNTSYYSLKVTGTSASIPDLLILDNAGTGALFIGKNNGTPTSNLSKIGVFTGTSFVKSGATSGNILLAGGTDIAQSTFATATGGTGYIQNQNASAQSANMWISGTGQFGSTVTASNGTLIGGTLTSGYIPKATGANSLGNSSMSQDANGNMTISGGAGSSQMVLNKSTGASIAMSGSSTNYISIEASNATSPDMIFYTSGEKARISTAGNLLINTSTDDGVNKLQVNGSTIATSFIASAGTVRLKNYTVATLPTGTQGDTAYVTDALTPTYLVAIVGGGAVVTPVFYNGTTWVAH